MITDKKGRDLLASAIEEIKSLDGRIYPFDSDKVMDLEAAVVASVRDFFGEDSPQFHEFEDFHIASGPVSLADSRTEKQAKYEVGLPMAVTRLNTLLQLMDQTAGTEKSRLKSGEKGMFTGKPETGGEKISGKGEVPGPAKKKPVSPPSGEKATPSKQAAPGTRARQPGKVLILQAGGDDITFAVTALMDKIGVDVLLLEEDNPIKVEEAATKGDLAFSLVCVSSLQKGGFSGLTAVISKPRPKHEMAFKLGLLVGRLGPGKVAILYGGEKPQDIPETLFGVHYLPFQEEGGWQIGFLKLLKKNGFFIDANLLFD